MTYTHFKNAIESLGPDWRVNCNNNIVRVYREGNWVATVFNDKPYNFNTQSGWEGYYDGEDKRRLMVQYVYQLAETEPKNRGRLPEKEVAL